MGTKIEKIVCPDLNSSSQGMYEAYVLFNDDNKPLGVMCKNAKPEGRCSNGCIYSKWEMFE
ncbi:MAG: hypothetical protein Q7R52_04020 [archaeon]|nr:hypothetical protein [archaeon]